MNEANSNPETRDRPGGAPGDTRDGPGGGTAHTLRRLEQRLDRASQAAESLLADAAGAAARGLGAKPKAPDSQSPPPAGWQVPHQAAEPGGTGGEIEVLLHALSSLRGLVPVDLQRQLAEAVRELLLAARALIDWYLERLERPQPEDSEVRDIPIL